MLNLTNEERKVALFLSTAALIGMGINIALKAAPVLEKVVKIDSRIAKIAINNAGYEDLLHTQRISPLLAKRIIDYRNLHGAFSSLEGLKEVKGIGDYRYEKLKEFLCLE